MAEKFYITTAIDYVNAKPHIGHAYQKIVADALARWNKLQNKNVYFLTGTDEYGKKIEDSAKKAGKKPKDFVEEISQKFKESWKKLNIAPDRFIRTTDEDHKKIVQEFIKKCDKTGDIYKGEYEGYYCTNCEAYYTERDAPELECPFHNEPLEKLKEESYFFRLSKYQDFLLKLYKKNPEFILPKERKNEIINRVKEGLKDFSITRASFDWGIPFPLDKKHITYVWFDALINYYTATQSENKLKKFWPADLHLLGKDNTWFHTVYWPAMLKYASLEIPKKTFNHGFLTFNGEKISKSLGNSISASHLAETYGADTVRYFVLRHFPFGKDGDFDETALKERHNNELADKLGNLVSRVSTLAEKYGIEKGKVNIDTSMIVRDISEFIEKYELDRALNSAFSFIDTLNQLIQDKKPWETKDSKVLYELSQGIRDAAILLSPFIPETCEKIAETFNFKISLGELEKPLKVSKIKKSPILFQKIK